MTTFEMVKQDRDKFLPTSLQRFCACRHVGHADLDPATPRLPILSSPKPVDGIDLKILILQMPIWTDFRGDFTAMLSSSFSQISFTVALVLSLAGTRLDAKSVIVDDSHTSQITYSAGWNIGNNCTGCYAQPDRTQAFNETWHEYVW